MSNLATSKNFKLYQEVEVSSDKSLCRELTKLEGVNFGRAHAFCKTLGLTQHTRFNQLSIPRQEEVIDALEANRLKLVTTGIRLNLIQNMIKLIKLKHYKGLRYCYGLPVRGQRTHTNRRTNRKMIIRIMRQIEEIKDQQKTTKKANNTPKLKKAKK
jgi:small subunit ribosomal protein S13